MGPRSKAKGTSRRFLQNGDLAHRFALSDDPEPTFPSAGIGQKGVEFAFDHDPKLGDLVTGRRQRLTGREWSHLDLAGDGLNCLGIQFRTKPRSRQPGDHAFGVNFWRWHADP